jgi:hypothetical protein
VKLRPVVGVGEMRKIKKWELETLGYHKVVWEGDVECPIDYLEQQHKPFIFKWKQLVLIFNFRIDYQVKITSYMYSQKNIQIGNSE